MIHAALGLVIAFILANIITEAVNAPAMNPLIQPMSAYLAGKKLSWLQDAGFFALGGALLSLGHIWGSFGISLAACIAIVVVVLTKWWIVDAHLNGTEASRLERLHVISAGVAFAGAALMILLHTWSTHGFAFWITCIGVAFTVLYQRFGVPAEADAVEEKVFTSCLMAAILSLLWSA
jgi:hypothetical protein